MTPLRIALAGTWVPLPSRGQGPANYNLAIGYLQAFLQQQAPAEVFRKDFALPLGSTRLHDGAADELLACDPHVLGLSSYCWDAEAFAALLPELKRRSPSVRIVLGGPTATFDAEAMMQRCPEIDFAVLGEGEQTLAALVRAGMHAGDIPGILSRDGAALRSSGPRPVPADLSWLRSPYLAGVLQPPQSQLTLEWSRGCVFRCKHCAWKNFLGGLRHVAVPVIAAELRWAVEHGYDGAFVLDAAINFDSSQLEAVTGAIARELPPDALRFSYFLSQHHFEPSQLQSLARLPAHEIWVGLESTHTRALRALSRPPFARAAFESFVLQVGTLGRVHVSIMLGIPGDTLQGFRQTVDYLAEAADRLGIGAVRVFWTLVPPGSYFAQHRERFGIRTVERAMPYLLGCSSFPTADLLEAFRFLYHHPRRDLFIYDDPLPALWLEGAAGLDFHHGSASAPQAAPKLPQEIWSRFLGSCGVGDPMVAGWTIRAMSLREGWPTLRLEKDARRVFIQLRTHAPGQPSFLRAGAYDLLWLRDDEAGARGQGPEPDLHRLMAFVASRVQGSRP